MHLLTSIPRRSLRVTMGNYELYPKEEKLSLSGKTTITISLKLRILGGVKETQMEG